MSSKMAFYPKGTSINLARAKIISDLRDLNKKFKFDHCFNIEQSFKRQNLNLNFLFTLDIISLLCKINLCLDLLTMVDVEGGLNNAPPIPRISNKK